MTTPYDVEAPWPHEVMESFMEAGLLHMTGTGTQSVLKMPNLSGIVLEFGVEIFDIILVGLYVFMIQKRTDSKVERRKGHLRTKTSFCNCHIDRSSNCND